MSFPPGQTPAIGIIPLGTGNDLSRSLNWGGKYQNKPLRKVLIDMAKADVTQMDRWTLKVAMDPSDLEDPADSTGSKPGQDQLVRYINLTFPNNQTEITREGLKAPDL